MKIICSIVLFQFAIIHVIGQNSPGLKTFITPSPTTAALGKYGEIPVSLYTGVPNINIPIYNVKGRGLELPISLSYHAGGNRVEEKASWVGLGWSLNAGGVITRTIRGGFPDFAPPGYFNRVASVTALAKKYLINRSPTTSYISRTGNAEANDLSTLSEIIDGIYDSEPDIYSFNFGKYSGKFFIAENGQLVVTPVQALKIEHIENSAIALNDVTDWILTTPDGVKYIFGNSSDALEKNNNGAITGNTITSWYLHQMISPGNEKIDFGYTDVSYHYASKAGEVINQIVDETPNPPAPLPFLDKRIVTNYITMPKLTSITYTKGVITFGADGNRNDLTGDTYLSSINIFSNADLVNPFKKYGFSYTNGARLRLIELQEISSANPSLVNKYGFEYSTQSLPDPDPDGTAINSQDLWGYYNGMSNNVLPQSYCIQGTPYGTINIYGADRHSDETYMQAEILTRINYPTGGYTLFDYEANTVNALNTDNSIPPASVVRQASITYLPPATNVTGVIEELIFIVQDPDPITHDVTVSVSSRQMMQGCPIDNVGNSLCYEASVQGINGTQFPQYFFKSGNSTIKLLPGAYKMVGKGVYYTGQLASNAVHLDLSWAEYPPQGGSTPTLVNKVMGGLRIKRITNFNGLKSIVKKYLYNKFSDATVSSSVLVNNPWSYVSIFELTNGGSTVYAQIKSYPLIPLMPTQGSAVGYQNVTELIGENGEGGKTEYTFTTAFDYGDETQQYRPYPPACQYDWKRGQLLSSVFYKNTGANFSPVKSVSNQYAFGINQQTGYGLTVERDIKVASGGTFALPPDPVNYYVSGYKTVSEFYYLQSETSRLYDQNIPGSYVESIINYDYDITKGHYQLVKQQTTNSKGEILTTNLKYPLDYTITGTPTNNTALGIQNLKTKNILNPVIEEYIQKSNAGGSNVRTLSSTFTSFNPTIPYPDIINKTESSQPLTNFTPAIITASATTVDSRYKPQVFFDSYDADGNVLQQHKTNDENHSYIWGYNNVMPIAEAINASQTDIAHTSFEADGTASFNAFSGSITPVITDATNTNMPPTGNKYYNLTPSYTLSKPVTSGKVYIISYWSKNLTTPYTVTGGTGTYKTGRTLNNLWKYFEHKITASSTTLTITGTGAIDEVRIYPDGAQMTTYTYEPLIGITSQCDINNRIIYYEYDGFNRLKLIRDQDKNILKRLDYQYKQPQ